MARSPEKGKWMKLSNSKLVKASNQNFVAEESIVIIYIIIYIYYFQHSQQHGEGKMWEIKNVNLISNILI